MRLKLEVPIVVTKFMDPLPLEAPQFFNMWGSIKEGPLSHTEVFNALYPINMPNIGKILSVGLRLQILEGVDNNKNNFALASVFTCTQGQVVCLLRLETNPQAQMMKLTIKAGNTTVLQALRKLILAQLAAT